MAATVRPPRERRVYRADGLVQSVTRCQTCGVVVEIREWFERAGRRERIYSDRCACVKVNPDGRELS
jgi:hypothetical protein